LNSGIQQAYNACEVEGMKRVAMFLTDEQLKKLRAMVKKTNLKLAEIVRRAIDDYLKREGQ
jgi:Ribbon-helix-helix domain